MNKTSTFLSYKNEIITASVYYSWEINFFFVYLYFTHHWKIQVIHLCQLADTLSDLLKWFFHNHSYLIFRLNLMHWIMYTFPSERRKRKPKNCFWNGFKINWIKKRYLWWVSVYPSFRSHRWTNIHPWALKASDQFLQCRE